MKKVNYIYWWRLNKKYGNFGDEITPYIFSRLTDDKFKYVNLKLVRDGNFRNFKVFTIKLITNKVSIRGYLYFMYYSFIKKPSICISTGSILQFCHYKNTTVWGSGLIAGQRKIPDVKYLAVRGPLTSRRLKEKGIDPPDSFGDPALLMPLLYRAVSQVDYKVAVIPHYRHYEKVKDKFAKDILVIDILDSVEQVINQLHRAKLVVSTSLHGIIVAHAYGIKSIWASHPDIPLRGGAFKFNDYFNSLGMEPYKPFSVKDFYGKSGADIAAFVQGVSSLNLLPEMEDIQSIQANLLRVFPFQLKPRYQGIIEAQTGKRNKKSGEYE